jgi:pantoate--beta-alanine ligase
MERIREIESLRDRVQREKRNAKTIGFVPTMGYLHEGHLSLVRLASSETDFVVVSIFVNPTQFSPNEDFEQYPREIERDILLVEKAGGDIIFEPNVNEIYPEGFCTWVEVETVTNRLCGTSRPSHFRGVATVVAKLFNIVQPDFAFFGQKDAQQAVVIRRLIRDLNYPIQLIVAPIVRDERGIALSSRNKYLSEKEREDAERLNQSLRLGQHLIREGNRNLPEILEKVKSTIKAKPTTRIDYVEFVDPITLGEITDLTDVREILLVMAVYVGKTRLIDNLLIRTGE